MLTIGCDGLCWQRNTPDDLTVPLVPQLQFRDGPGDGFDLRFSEPRGSVDGPPSRERHVGNVRLTFQFVDCTERLDESAVESLQFRALDGEIDDRSRAARRLREVIDLRDPGLERGGARQHRPQALGQSIRADTCGLTLAQALDQQRVALSDPVERSQLGKQLRGQAFDATGDGGVDAVHTCSLRRAVYSLSKKPEHDQDDDHETDDRRERSEEELHDGGDDLDQDPDDDQDQNDLQQIVRIEFRAEGRGVPWNAE